MRNMLRRINRTFSFSVSHKLFLSPQQYSLSHLSFLRPITALFHTPHQTKTNMFASGSLSYLTHREVAAIEEALLGPLGFTIDQRMELAGLSVATSIAEVYKTEEYNRILVICGPENNGGEGLVTARHLHHFGFKPSICYPIRTVKPLHNGLVTQLESLSVAFISVDDLPEDLSKDFEVIVDAIFGFSFQGAPQPPFDDLIRRLVSLQKLVIVSVDIPSGWHVEEGEPKDGGIKPDMLVSITAPKLCARRFSGPHHFLGGRYLPPSVSQKYNLKLPSYPGTSMCVRVGIPPKALNLSAMRLNYVSPELLEEQVENDPHLQFRKWFVEAVASGFGDTYAMALSTVNRDKKPSSRMVLLQGFDEDGFVWFTNYGSKKGSHLSENPSAALLFYWGNINRQVRIEGAVERISEAESENSYHSCPRGIQIEAIVSKQSSVVPDRHVLYQEYEDVRKKYSHGKAIPKPETWGGFRLKPNLFEFWQGQASRLHDRLQYTLEDVNGNPSWIIRRLAP